MNKTLIVGYKGNMGRRYQAVFNCLKAPWIGVDIGDKWPNNDTYEQVLICTPTESHYQNCIKAISKGKRFLCEKPICKNDDDLKHLIKLGGKGSMVNNWWWAIRIRFEYMPDVKTINYNYYNTGNDGVEWDCIQPIYIANKTQIKTDSPVFQCFVNGKELTRFFFDASYIDMIKAWLSGNTLWSLEQALEANQKVREYVDMHTI